MSVGKRYNTHQYTGDIQITDGTLVAEIDRLGYLSEIAIEHHKVHEGKYFTASDYQTSSNPVYWLMINPAATKEYHCVLGFASDVAGLFEFFNAVDCGTFAKGTQFYAYNNNGLVGGTSTLQFWAAPLGLTGTGNKLNYTQVGAGGPQRVGGEARANDEIILANNGTYAMRFTPSAAAKTVFTNGLYEV